MLATSTAFSDIAMTDQYAATLHRLLASYHLQKAQAAKDEMVRHHHFNFATRLNAEAMQMERKATERPN